jgi:hypothetical protein
MRRALKIAGILGLLAYLPMILLYGGCVTGLGPWAVPGVELFIIVSFAALAASVLALPFMLFRRTRKGGLVAAVTGIGMVILIHSCNGSIRAPSPAGISVGCRES